MIGGRASVGRSIRERRTHCALSLGVLADRAGISPQELSAIEHDAQRPSDAALTRIATELSLDVARIRTMHALADRARMLRGAPREDVTAVIDDVLRTHPRAFVARDRREIEKFAAKVRTSLPLTNDRLFASSLFEHLTQLAVTVGNDEYAVDTAVQPLARRVEACTCVDVRRRVFQINLSPEAYQQMHRRGSPRILFTICHELGHLFLHRSELIAAGGRGEIPEGSPPRHLDVERQADAFAGALIAPIESVLALHDQMGHISAVDLSRGFGYSAPAAEVRIETIQSLRPGRLTLFDPQWRLFPKLSAAEDVLKRR